MLGKKVGGLCKVRGAAAAYHFPDFETEILMSTSSLNQAAIAAAPCQEASSLAAGDASAPFSRSYARREEVAAMYRRFGPGYRRLALCSVLLGTTAAVMEATIVNVALAPIARHFALTQDHLQLLSAGFLAAATVSMLLTPWAIDRFGIRPLYRWAMLLLIGFSLAAALAPGMGVLAACRVAQGIVAGLLQPLAMLVIADIYPVESRGSAMSAYGFGVVLSPILGPLCGGALIDLFDWRAVFLVTVPLCATGWLLAERYLIRGTPAAHAKRPTLDGWGLFLVGAAIFCLLAGLTALLSRPMAAGIALLAGATLALCFRAQQRRARRPLLDPSIFDYPRFVSALLASLIYGMGIYSTSFLVPQFAQTALGMSAFQTSASFLPGGILTAIVVLNAGRLSDRLQPGRVAAWGLGCYAVSSVLLGLSSGHSGFWTLALWVALGQVGLGLIIPGLNAGALRLLPEGAESAGSAAVSFSRQAGGTFGVALLALYIEILHRHFHVDPLAALQQGFFIVAAFYLLAQWPIRHMRRSSAG